MLLQGRQMPDTWVTDMTHFLDERGKVPVMPAPVRRLVDHFGAIVIAASGSPLKAQVSTGVKCRRRPGHRRCPGEIRARFDPDDSIMWACPSCGDRGLIHGWKSTIWDSRGRAPARERHFGGH